MHLKRFTYQPRNCVRFKPSITTMLGSRSVCSQLQLMLNGISRMVKRSDFIYDAICEPGFIVRPYPHWHRLMVGNAGVCAAYELFDKEPTFETIKDVRARADYFEYDRISLECFEESMNKAAYGDIRGLIYNAYGRPGDGYYYSSLKLFAQTEQPVLYQSGKEMLQRYSGICDVTFSPLSNIIREPFVTSGYQGWFLQTSEIPLSLYRNMYKVQTLINKLEPTLTNYTKNMSFTRKTPLKKPWPEHQIGKALPILPAAKYKEGDTLWALCADGFVKGTVKWVVRHKGEWWYTGIDGDNVHGRKECEVFTTPHECAEYYIDKVLNTKQFDKPTELNI